MASLDHWHPVLLSKRLKKAPIGIKLCGKELVLFRCNSGKVGCLVDICPHRRMRLSLGKVVGDKLRCQYHGWTFTCQGEGESPATPKLYACAEHFDAIEKFGAVWVKPTGAAAEFPRFEIDGYY